MQVCVIVGNVHSRKKGVEFLSFRTFCFLAVLFEFLDLSCLFYPVQFSTRSFDSNILDILFNTDILFRARKARESRSLKVH